MSQPREALAKARATQDRRFEIKRQLETAETYAHCVLDDPALKNAYLRQVLSWQRGWGNVKIGACLGALGAYNPKCPDLTEEQRAILSYYCTWTGRAESAVPPRPPGARTRHPADQ